MAVETVISFVIVLVSTAPIFMIGIAQYRSQEPVGFWSGKKPPQKEQITDVRAYNRKHGLMWILLGAGFIFSFVCGFFFGKWIAGYLCMIEVIGGILAMIVYHERLNRIYRKK